MKAISAVAIAATLALGTPAVAQEFVQDPVILQLVIDSGVCGNAGVERAELLADGNISANCLDDDPTAFVPLAGGLGTIVAGAGALAALAAAAGAFGATSDTQ